MRIAPASAHNAETQLRNATGTTAEDDFQPAAAFDFAASAAPEPTIRRASLAACKGIANRINMFEVISQKTGKATNDDDGQLIAAVPATDKLACGTASAGIILNEVDMDDDLDDASTEADEEEVAPQPTSSPALPPAGEIKDTDAVQEAVLEETVLEETVPEEVVPEEAAEEAALEEAAVEVMEEAAEGNLLVAEEAPEEAPEAADEAADESVETVQVAEAATVPEAADKAPPMAEEDVAEEAPEADVPAQDDPCVAQAPHLAVALPTVDDQADEALSRHSSLGLVQLGSPVPPTPLALPDTLPEGLEPEGPAPCASPSQGPTRVTPPKAPSGEAELDLGPLVDVTTSFNLLRTPAAEPGSPGGEAPGSVWDALLQRNTSPVVGHRRCSQSCSRAHTEHGAWQGLQEQRCQKAGSTVCEPPRPPQRQAEQRGAHARTCHHARIHHPRDGQHSKAIGHQARGHCRCV